MKLGGIDPSILRELSGGYKPFVKALKELVSNAYDADAEVVRISLSPDFKEVEITDDGHGMTPFDFHHDFTKLGGSYKRITKGLTRKKRRKIGSKGIGFLAVLRYCSQIEILSTTLRTHSGKLHVNRPTRTIDVQRLLPFPISRKLVFELLTITSVTFMSGSKTDRLKRSNYELGPNGQLRINIDEKRLRAADTIEIKYSLNCRTLEFKAIIDFDYLLSLENKKDLSRLADFCTMEVYVLEENDPHKRQHYTRITIKGLKDFVSRDLKAIRKSGRVRNLESESGLDQFVWQLSRCTPIQYDLDAPIHKLFGADNMESQESESIDRVIFCGPSGELELKRPLWRGNPDQHWNSSEDVATSVDIHQDGLRARGYILGHRQAIFPAEYRGIAVRVRNVQVGPPGFFGLEQTLTGPSRALLTQITGEINVLEGLDATDALNPGRDSFYEENVHYKILRKQLIGDGEEVTGLLGFLIKLMLERMQVLSSVESHLSKANSYRAALLNLSMAINHYGVNSNDGINLQQFFTSTLRANGLSNREDYDTLPGPRVGGFRVKSKPELEFEHHIDFEDKTVYLNFGHERWSNKMFVLGQYYQVVPKKGDSRDPLCEIDTAEKKLYVNWGHPLRQQMGDVAFIKSSVAWKLSYHACHGDIEAMMDLALKLLTFNGA